jgi:hypothetical protein
MRRTLAVLLAAGALLGAPAVAPVIEPVGAPIAVAEAHKCSRGYKHGSSAASTSAFAGDSTALAVGTASTTSTAFTATRRTAMATTTCTRAGRR